MTNIAPSPSDHQNTWSREIRRLRFCRLPLLLALLIVGAHAVGISLGHFGWGAPGASSGPEAVAAIGSASSGELEGPATQAGETTSGDTGRESQVPLVEGTAIEKTPWLENGTDPSIQQTGNAAQPADGPDAHALALTEGDGILETVENAVETYRSSVERGLIDAGEVVRKTADSNLSIAGSKIGGLLETLAEADQTAAIRALEEGRAGYSGRDSSEEGDAVLLNPADNGGVIHYLVNGQLYSLGPGETHNLGPGTSCRVQFHRGGDFGNAEYTVASGAHAFQVTENGWELQVVSRSDLP